MDKVSGIMCLKRLRKSAIMVCRIVDKEGPWSIDNSSKGIRKDAFEGVMKVHNEMPVLWGNVPIYWTFNSVV